ncbi:ankyrin repeat-containing domain, PGG domain protein [Artemisia annua]|uniref:Ankyrin repeat-containing domain, PGG domain protein n=1 Tax=Artemisia annua TaxID=35608 RepID=A0A2U1LGS2_ARTAN|nr:ankyrin repeat-containing domain, PGG domain protein [Artemisia annua]
MDGRWGFVHWENILWDNKWNQGILDCVPDAFINAFTTLVKSIVNAPVSSLPQMFRFLPITNPSHPNLKRVQDSIQAKLMNETIVPCESFTSEKLFRKPHEVYKLLPSFRSILNAAKSQHVSFSTNIVSQGAYFLTSSLDEIEYHSILNFLRIRDLDPKWYVRCIASSNIVMGVSDDVYLQLLVFIADLNIQEDGRRIDTKKVKKIQFLTKIKMMNAASTSNPSFIVNVGEAYPYPSHVIAPNFVTVKLSGKNKYNMWKTQMLCLLKSHQMYGFIDGHIPRPAGNGKGKQKNPDFTAKDLWDELQHSYGPSVREQVAETKLTTRQAEIVIEVSSHEEEKTRKIPYEDFYKRRIYNCVLEGNTRSIVDQLGRFGLTPWDKLMNNGNTVLHVAVGSSTKNHELLKKLLEMTPPEYTLLDLVNSDGSGLLHVAAIGGNTEAVDMLVERNPELLLAKDKEGHTPLTLSVSNMHTETSKCLFQHMRANGYGSNYFSGESGEEIVVLAISCQDFSLANQIIRHYDAILPNSEAVLTALAQNFPRELNFWENRGDEFVDALKRTIQPYEATRDRLEEYFNWPCGHQLFITCFFLFVGLCAMKTVFYGLLKVLVGLFFEDTFYIHKDAGNLLFDVCVKILSKYNSSTYHQYYTTSTFEATRRNASTFIRCIMGLFPNAIWSTNEDGHNFIQYSVINRSEKIYNLIYEMSEHKNIYKTIKDSSGNNLLHLAARLAPTNKLNLISGAALQIQRELQWFKEVERFVCPLNRIQKNLDDETPEMVFTREHKDLVIEGESWIKKTTESYTITAALIITIVFAAAITVPGGNNQESGIPLFTNNIAFTVFAISDAISLFTAVTSLLMFLSILTARFAEQDFLFKLPTKLIIGLTMLFLSTTAMIIAFGATLFLVFGQRNLLMLIPIGALTCLPITSFVTLQFPLIMELISATYCGRIFVKEEYDYFY